MRFNAHEREPIGFSDSHISLVTPDQNANDTPATSSIFETYEIPNFDDVLNEVGAFDYWLDYHWEPDYYADVPFEMLQSFKRVHALGYDTQATFLYPDETLNNLRTSIDEVLDELKDSWFSRRGVTFQGTRTSELNDVIAQNPEATIYIEQSEISADVALNMVSNVRIVGAPTTFKFAGAISAIEARNIHDFSVENISVTSPEFSVGLHVNDCSRFTLLNIIVENVSFRPMSITRACHDFEVANCSLRFNRVGGLFVNGNSSRGYIHDNVISSNAGTWNNEAAIVLGSFKFVDATSLDTVFWEPELYELLESPHDIIVSRNSLVENSGQGCYSYGAYRCFFTDNVASSNKKEGMCLDYGSLGWYLEGNEFNNNGYRIGVDDNEPEHNKLPGVSMDNACYNIIRQNKFSFNAGSGVKAVRASARNLVVDNDIDSNNQGSSLWAHFFGVEWASDLKPDYEGAAGLDFAPCFNNITAANRITGLHFSGMYLGEDCWANGFFNNDISGEEAFAFEIRTYQDNLFRQNVYDGLVYDNGDIRY